MVAPYQDSRLWKSAIADCGDGLDAQCGVLREAYKKFHDNAVVFAAQVRADLPDLTDHGADHFNGLWHLASKITGAGCELNPAEAFVFGGAILLHDAGNCLAAYPGGLEAIRKSDAWRDVVAQWGLKEDTLAKGSPGGRSYMGDGMGREARRALFADAGLGREVVHALRHHDLAGDSETLAFVVMPDHFHWLFALGEGISLDRLVKSVKSFSARRINQHLGGRGRVWQSGFHDHALRHDEDVVHVARYVVANPLRAGLVERLGDYPLWDAAFL